ncbi:MAG: hypothetical protein LBH51_08220 [Treponema sp.]|jgi:hypothetical protein|nr:hypothetical protein [Treponema sp.]
MVPLPVVLRARGFRLYTQGGGRLVDLWQAGGRAVLGHNPAGVLRDLKNYANRGLFAPLPHSLERRLAKGLARLLPGRVFRFYPDQPSLCSALGTAGFSRGPFPDPAFIGAKPEPAENSFPGPSRTGPVPAAKPAARRGPELWRPFLEDAVNPPDFRTLPILVPLLPWPLAPWVLALDPALESRFPPPAPIPPVLLAAAARALYDLIAAGPQGGRPVYPRINQAVYRNSPGAAKPWRRRGIYLICHPLQSQAGGGDPSPVLPAPAESPGWESLFLRFLEGGFLIPPDPGEPLILPVVLSPGEEAKLAALLRETGGHSP